MKDSPSPSKVYAPLGVLQVLIGLGALGGGFMLILDPSGGKLGLPNDLLEGSPFSNFLIPGVFLFLVNGLGSMLGSVFSFRRRRFAEELAMALGGILVAWIVIQVLLIQSVGWLHLIYFVLGMVEFGMGLYIRRHHGRTV